MVKIKRKEGYFSISAIAKMFSVHQQTIRLYEKQGLLTPQRSAGNTRLFSEEDIERLEEIIHLTHNLGINLAGVEMILKLKKQIKKLQKDMNRAFEATQKDLEQESLAAQEVVQEHMTRLSQLKKIATGHRSSLLTSNQSSQPTSSAKKNDQDLPWNVDYSEED